MNNNYSIKINFFAIMTALIAAFAGFTLGFDAGFAIDAKDQVMRLFNLSDFQWSFMASMSIIGALIAIPISGKFVDKFGSKNLLQLTAFGFIVGLVLAITSQNLNQLAIGRFIIGICIGIASYTTPLFIAEISPSTIRGGMVLLNGLAITIGQTLAFLVSYIIHDKSFASWRIILSIEILPALILFIGMFFIPQSPRWIAKRFDIDALRNILLKLRPHNVGTLETEINEIKQTVIADTSTASFKNLFSKKILPVLLVGTGLGVFQQFVGISAIMYYGPVVFEALGFNTVKEGILATFCISLINFILTIFSTFLIDKLGRRPLLLGGTFLAALSMGLIGLVCLGKLDAQWGLLFAITYITGYCISLGSLFWVLISEIFPTYIRGTAMSFATTVQCGANFLVSVTFLQCFSHLGTANTFFLYGLMSFLALVFIYYFIPETKGVTLELIETNLRKGKKIRELGATF